MTFEKYMDSRKELIIQKIPVYKVFFVLSKEI